VARQLSQGISAGKSTGQIARSQWRRAVRLTAVVLAAGLLTAACGGGSTKATGGSAPVANGDSVTSQGAGGTSGTPGGAVTSSSAPPLVLTSAPADGAANVDPSKGLQLSAAGGTIESVTAADSKGNAVKGTIAADGSSWTSDSTLAISSSYTVTAKAKDAAGTEKVITEKFTTLTPQKRLGLNHYFPDDGTTVGIGQPVAVYFTNAPNQKNRDAVEKAMTVTTTPHVDGAWSWQSPTQVDWRPQNYWAAGTKVSVQMNLNGVKAGDITYGSFNKDFSFTIGAAQHAVVDTAHFHMLVYSGDTLVKTIPTDTGKAGFSTWGGTMVVLDKQPMIEMKSCSVPGFSCTPGAPTYYDLKVYNDVHLTDSGTYIHQAEWDGNIGTDNTSHGCVHLNVADSTWFYNFIHVGDPVTITGEPDQVHQGNGYTDWNEDWKTWLAGSAAGVQAAQ
jgi:lipoprotein-anchoring transpeptidase ErfK/SrfK